jgi:hypothetical protein
MGVAGERSRAVRASEGFSSHVLSRQTCARAAQALALHGLRGALHQLDTWVDAHLLARPQHRRLGPVASRAVVSARTASESTEQQRPGSRESTSSHGDHVRWHPKSLRDNLLSACRLTPQLCTALLLLSLCLMLSQVLGITGWRTHLKIVFLSSLTTWLSCPCVRDEYTMTGSTSSSPVTGLHAAVPTCRGPDQP